MFFAELSGPADASSSNRSELLLQNQVNRPFRGWPCIRRFGRDV